MPLEQEAQRWVAPPKALGVKSALLSALLLFLGIWHIATTAPPRAAAHPRRRRRAASRRWAR
jgi:hypothetical protein